MRWGTGCGARANPARQRALVLGAGLLSLAMLGCSGVSTQRSPTPAARPGAPESAPAAEVVALTNARRADAGCGPVTAQGQLTRAAQLHADDMAAHDYFSHTGRDGRAPWDRARAQNYTGRGIGENIARGYPTARAVMDGWMGSRGHRTNIENCAYRHIGVGYDAGTRTWVQMFGS